MKILSYDEKQGSMRVYPETIDDLWILYNVIRSGDYIYARTSREIKVKEKMARPTKGKRIALSLGIRVEKLAFQRGNNRLRVNGVIIKAPEKFGLLGNYHTITIALRRSITILKKEWLNFDLERMKRAARERSNPFIVVSIDDRKGCVALLHQHSVDVKAEIAGRLPGKLEAEKRSAALTKYYDLVLKELVATWNYYHGLIAIIGPGFYKENFSKHVRVKQPDLFKAISAISTVGNGGIEGVNEAIRSGVLDIVARKMRMIEETRTVEKFLSYLASQHQNVSYGIGDVKRAVSYGAVELLLVADALLRNAIDDERLGLEELMRDAEKMRGRVMMVSAEHEAGKKLLSFGGLAVFLRFPIG